MGQIRPSKPSYKTDPTDTLISGILNYERINSCYFKLHSLWQFVQAALGNQCT